jgi:hypothetical protein
MNSEKGIWRSKQDQINCSNVVIRANKLEEKDTVRTENFGNEEFRGGAVIW